MANDVAGAEEITVTIDPSREQVLTFTEATKLPWLKVNGKRANPATLWRWHDQGVYGIKLETLMIGAKSLVTTESALVRFTQAVTAEDRRRRRARHAAPGAPIPRKRPAKDQRAAEVDRANAKQAAAGW
jgi:hypothetical protein